MVNLLYISKYIDNSYNIFNWDDEKFVQKYMIHWKFIVNVIALKAMLMSIHPSEEEKKDQQFQI